MRYLPTFYVILKSFIWILIGIFFGISTFVLVFASKYLYGQPFDFNKYLSYEYIMYLCVALMAGAAADYGNYPRGWKRIIPLFFCSMLLLILYIVFNPQIPQHPRESVVKIMAIVYSGVAFVFCMIIKSTIFLEECSELDPIKF